MVNDESSDTFLGDEYPEVRKIKFIGRESPENAIMFWQLSYVEINVVIERMKMNEVNRTRELDVERNTIENRFLYTCCVMMTTL